MTWVDNDWMLYGNAPATSGNCGTPTLFFADGQRTTGAIPADQIKKLLDDAR